MRNWKKTFEGQTLIAHISDLHFGSDNQLSCWEKFVNFLKSDIQPGLILVTGDIADSANHLNVDVREELAMPEVDSGKPGQKPQGVAT